MKYRLEQLNCPSCGASIDMDIQGRKAVFCPFCGSQFAIEDEEEITTKNININKNINIHKRYTNDAALERERRKDRENERKHREEKWAIIGALLFLIVDFAFLGIMGMKEEWDAKKAIEAGMIKVGQSSSDMEGKNYQAVIEQLDSAGFTNITTVELNDAGWFSNKKDTIESVTIGGEVSFSSSDFFDPDARVVISYH